MLAAAAASKIDSRQENLCVAVSRVVKHGIRSAATIAVVSPVVKNVIAKTGAGGAF